MKYRGIFLNDEQPALQNWAAEKFSNGTGAFFTGSPFNHVFYAKLYVYGESWDEEQGINATLGLS